MLTLTKKTDYALIALAHLAREPGRMASAREIGDQNHVPVPLLMNVLKTLARGGLVQSIRGARGGYALAADPEKTTLAQLIEAVEGPVRFVQCAGHTKNGRKAICKLEEFCPVRTPTMRVHARLKAFFSTVMLSEIIGDAKGQNDGTGCFDAKELVDEESRVS